jgi:hypothetical protein
VKQVRESEAAPAYVVRSSDRWTSIFPECTETQDLDVLKSITQSISKLSKSWTFGCLVHDSDIFNYVLFKDGVEMDCYDSAPGYFEGDETAPSGGNLEMLAGLCREKCSKEDLANILHSEDEDEYLFAELRWYKLANLLGIEEDHAAVGFEYIESDEGADKYQLVN